MQIDTRLRMTQERPRMQMKKQQYFDQHIWDMSIDITFFVLHILQVGISRSTYYISFERMCLTVICALWSPAGKELTSWLSFVVSNCEFVTFTLLSWVRCGILLYRFLIFAH